jgi:6-pyruvoyltetrahydropterin/6-carboxytetrahydropterin synthase
MLTITKEFSFDAAHLLENHPAKCKNLHGHTYKMFVTVSKEELDNNMVIDFGDLKRIVNETLIDKIDHSFIYNCNTDKEYVNEIVKVLEDNGLKTYKFETRTTCEEMIQVIFDLLEKELEKENIKLESIKLYEGAGSYAEYSKN